MIACDWCKEKRKGRWEVVVTDKDEATYGKGVTKVVLCDAHYEPIRTVAVKGGKDG